MVRRAVQRERKRLLSRTPKSQQGSERERERERAGAEDTVNKSIKERSGRCNEIRTNTTSHHTMNARTLSIKRRVYCVKQKKKKKTMTTIFLMIRVRTKLMLGMSVHSFEE
jgi:hypothetical protein